MLFYSFVSCIPVPAHEFSCPVPSQPSPAQPIPSRPGLCLYLCLSMHMYMSLSLSQSRPYPSLCPCPPPCLCLVPSRPITVSPPPDPPVVLVVLVVTTRFPRFLSRLPRDAPDRPIHYRLGFGASAAVTKAVAAVRGGGMVWPARAVW